MADETKAKSYGHLFLPLAAALAAAGVGQVCSPRSAAAAEMTTTPFPLSEAASRLGGKYAVAVTYEDPILLRSDETLLTGNDPGSAFSYQAVSRPLLMPGDLTPGVTPRLDATALGKLLDSFYAANPGGPRFRILESNYGLHIVPGAVRDEDGRYVRAFTPLDAIVSVPSAVRLASEHLRELAKALTETSGVDVLPGGSLLDALYAANGLIPPRALGLITVPPPPASRGRSTPDAKRPYSFSWGASGVTGREALLSLLTGSASTLAWQVLCHSVPAPGRSLCILHVVALDVTVTEPDGRRVVRPLAYDRCTRCPPLPAPPPTKP